MKKYGYIYKSTNLVNGRPYIGQTTKKSKRQYLGSGLLIRRAVNKYGRENFKLEIIAYANSQKQLDQLEKDIIFSYRKRLGKKLYNIANGGYGIGKHSKETKEKLSKANLGKKLTKEHKIKIGLASKGNKYGLGHTWTEERKKKLSNMFKGRKVSKATRKRMSIAQKKVFHPSGKDAVAYGHRCTEEAKLRMSLARRGKKLSRRTRFKLRKAHLGSNNHFYGKHHTEETKEKISLAKLGKPSPWKGKHFTKASLKRLIKSHKGIRPSLETRNRMKIAQQIRRQKEEELKYANSN